MAEKARYGLQRRVGAAELDALGLRALRVQRDAHRRRAVALASTPGSPAPRSPGTSRLYELVVGLAKASTDRAWCEQPADVPAGHVRQPGVAGLVVEQRLAALPQRLVHVHARAVVPKIGLGMNVAVLPCAHATFLTTYLNSISWSAWRSSESNGCRSRPGRRCPPRGAAPRPRCRRSMQRQRHLGAQVLVLVHRRDREVPLLVAGLVAEVRAARRGRCSTSPRPSRPE